MTHQSHPAPTVSLAPPGQRRVSTKLRLHALTNFLGPWLVLAMFVPIAVSYYTTGGFIEDGLLSLVGEGVTGRVLAVEADGSEEADRVTYGYQLPGGATRSADAWAKPGYAAVGDPVSLEVVDAPIEVSRVVGTELSAGSSPIGFAFSWSIMFGLFWLAAGSSRRMKLNFQTERLLRRGGLTTAVRVPTEEPAVNPADPEEATGVTFQTRDAHGRCRELTLWHDGESQLAAATTVPILVDPHTPGVALALTGAKGVGSGDTDCDVLLALDEDVLVTSSGGLVSRSGSRTLRVAAGLAGVGLFLGGLTPFVQ